MSTALNTAFVISAALHRKAVTGLGQRLDVAMMDTAIVMQAAQYSNYLNQGSLVGLRGNSSPTRQPTADVFPTSDGYIQITALRQPQVEKLFAELGLTDMLSKEEFSTPPNRIRNPAPIREAMSQALQQKSTATWMKQLAQTGVPVAEVRELPEVVDDPQFEGRNAFETLESPIVEGESIRLAKAGYVTDADGPTVTSGPPRLGSHTEEILQGIGYDEKQISALREAGTI
jgi:crotonobetainyl-CoA:carnitine CoA-transferase CaiB-like acyl-CoA transferase